MALSFLKHLNYLCWEGRDISKSDVLGTFFLLALHRVLPAHVVEMANLVHLAILDHLDPQARQVRLALVE